MTYKLTFLESARKEWDDLPSTIQKQLKAKLFKIIERPYIPKNKLSGLKDCYKIKLRASGYRLVYRVYEDRIVVEVVAIGKRDKSAIYKLVRQRL
ncbi:MAG: hypothetical protein K0R76_468 [Alphaproteobacteria bacterium]|jgi:mRNA interferase RelE/StbE|nr:hypothetical protein [Alphaproteobacteria bacterium]